MSEIETKPIGRHDAVLGCLVGTAVGDALGLPYEGLSPARARRLLGPPDRHRFLFGRGMFSDDTEHTCMVLQSLLTADGDVLNFQRELASRLRLWLLSLPAGTGLATARAILKLWVGFSPPSSAVFSAGNGSAMRSAILGVLLPLEQIKEFVVASTEITHSDPKAQWGALAVALAAHLASYGRNVDPNEYLSLLATQLESEPAEEFLNLMRLACEGINAFDSTASYCVSVISARGVSGYVYQTVPVAIHAWLRHQHDYRVAIEEVIRCGGDADTTAAIVGGIVGASTGPSGIPDVWRRRICDWPLTMGWLEKLAVVATHDSSLERKNVPSLPFFGRLLRNLIFLPIVLAHGFRRLAPPY